MVAVDTALAHPELVRAGSPVGGLAAGDLDGWLDGFLEWIPGPDRRLADMDPELVQHVREMGRNTMRRHAPGEPDHSVPVPDAEARVKELTLPILAIDGAADVPGNLRTVAALVDAVPHGRRVRLDGVGPYITLEAPDEVIRLVHGFIREIDAA